MGSSAVAKLAERVERTDFREQLAHTDCGLATWTVRIPGVSITHPPLYIA
jgi:hypothetical protein